MKLDLARTYENHHNLTSAVRLIDWAQWYLPEALDRTFDMGDLVPLAWDMAEAAEPVYGPDCREGIELCRKAGGGRMSIEELKKAMRAIKERQSPPRLERQIAPAVSLEEAVRYNASTTYGPTHQRRYSSFCAVLDKMSDDILALYVQREIPEIGNQLGPRGMDYNHAWEAARSSAVGVKVRSEHATLARKRLPNPFKPGSVDFDGPYLPEA